jgi:hypothetical protein
VSQNYNPLVRSSRPKPVIDPAGRWHPSTSAAALANGVRPSGVYQNIALKRGGWRYADSEQNPPTPAA